MAAATAVAVDPKQYAQEAVKKITAIATLPEVTSKIISTVEDPKASASTLHKIVSHDPALANAPTGFEVTVRDVRAYTGAGWLVALCGAMQTMPGLGAAPAAFNVDIDEDGRTVGLF